MKKVLCIGLSLLLIIGLMGCGTKKTTCKVCGKEASCHQITYHLKSDSSIKESHWVCSKECEKNLDAIMLLAGAVR